MALRGELRVSSRASSLASTPVAWLIRSFCLALVLGLAAGCASPRGGGSRRRVVTHYVARGDTVWLIAQRYRTTVDAVVRMNKLRDANAISVGQRLRIPTRRSMTATRTTRPSDGGASKSSAGVRWSWPVDGTISSGFGWRWTRPHYGIDIAADSGTPVRAAASGRVVHSGSGVTGYGNLIILKHLGTTASVYAHNRRNLVRVGEWVEKGQVIAEVGETGRASGPHLHFEVREDGHPQNPLEFLP